MLLCAICLVAPPSMSETDVMGLYHARANGAIVLGVGIFARLSGIEFELGAEYRRKRIHRHLQALCVSLCATRQPVQSAARRRAERCPSFRFAAPHFPTTCLREVCDASAICVGARRNYAGAASGVGDAGSRMRLSSSPSTVSLAMRWRAS